MVKTRNDFAFGNKLLALRQQTGLTQGALAEQLGVSNKAVSKWETGKAKPTTNTLRKLAALYGLPVEELLRLKEREKMPVITKVVITGGPGR